MNETRGLLLIVGIASALLLASCDTTLLAESESPQKPEPSETANGPIVASIDVAKTTFEMHNEGDGLLAVEVVHPGLQTTVEGGYFGDWNVLRATETCGWLADPNEENATGCDIELPRVLYGRVTNPDVGYVCVGTIEESADGGEVTGARILPSDKNGYIFEVAQPGEVPTAHMLTSGGSRLGDPPLDAPSDPIHKFCEDATGIEEPEVALVVDLLVNLDESLRNDDLTIMLLSGLHRGGIDLSAREGGEPFQFIVEVTPSALRFAVELFDENYTQPIMSTELAWPEEIYELLASNEPCSGQTIVEVIVGPDVLEEAEDAVDVRYVGSECPRDGA